MELKCKYHEELDYKYLKPTKPLIQMAYKQLLSDYKNSVNGIRQSYESKRTFYFNYFKIRNGNEVIRYEFVYWVRSGKNEWQYNEEGNQFIFMGAHNYAKKHGIENEKRAFTRMGGYVFRPTYDDFVYSYEVEKIDYNAFRHMGSKAYDESFKNIKINDYLTISGVGKHCPILQRWLNSDPNVFEMLYKFDFKELLGYKISTPRLNFLKSHVKFLPKNITKPELDLAYSLYLNNRDWKDYRTIKNDISYYYNKINVYEFDITGREQNWSKSKNIYSSTNLKTYFRIQNLFKEKIESLSDIKTFLGVCWWYNLDFNKEIFKGKKERDSIVEMYFEDKKKHEKKLKAERARQARKYKKRMAIEAERQRIRNERLKNLTLPEITNNYIDLVIEDFLMKPIRTMREFSDISTEMDLCLMSNNYYKKVILEESVIYIVVPKDKKNIEGLVVEWKIDENKKLRLGQVSGIGNKTTPDYDAVKKIAGRLTYQDLTQKGA